MKKSLIEKIKEYRLEKGLTQEQFAFLTKLSRSYITRLERGDYDEKRISVGTMEKLSEFI